MITVIMQISSVISAPVSGSFASATTMPSIDTPAVPTAPATDAPFGAPLIDFPGVATGQRFVVGKGTSVGKYGSVSGTADILKFDSDAASFHIHAGKFGINVDMNVDVKRLDGDHVLLHTGATSISPESDIVARTVVSRTNYAEFQGVDDPTIHTTIQRDSSNNIVIDASIPQAGGPTHIVLNPKV